MEGYYTLDELKKKGITIHGTNILVSTMCNIYNPRNLILHDHIRIDDFTIISCKGLVEIFNYVHIGSACSITSTTKIIISEFCGISSGTKIFGGCDDFSGKYLTNPTVPCEYTNVKKGDIILEKHTIIGANSVILPNVILKEGTSIGALSLVNKSTKEWTIYAGCPIKSIKIRHKDCLELEKKIYENKL
jgi:dTDP-4-amino-4,6-dideoxy-D-glucose acyltransferase